MQLRDYQLEVINLILNNQEPTQLYVLPTGAGKTIIFSELTRLLLEQGKKVLILAHRTILINQIKKYNNFDFNLRVETKQSYANKLNFYPDYIIIDEAHNVDMGKNSQYGKIIKAHQDTSIIIGFTATPIRLDNGLIYGNNKLFKKLHYQLTPLNLINQEYLVPYKVMIPYNFVDKEQGFTKDLSDKKVEEIMTKKMLLDAVVDAYKEFARNKTLIFATSINHSEILQQELAKKGILSKTIHSNLHKDNINAILKDFNSQYLNCLINVNMLTEGFDEPQVDTLILARPTTSIALHRQIIGRGLRLSKGKIDCLVVDLVGNFNRLGDINDSLKDKESRKKTPLICPFCYIEMFKSCEKCGFEFPKELKENYEEIRKDKDATSLVAEDYKVLDMFSKQLNMQLILDVSIRKTSMHMLFTFKVRKVLENGNWELDSFIMPFTAKSIYFLKQFLNKFGFKNLNEEEESLDYYYNAIKTKLNNFKLRYVDYSIKEDNGRQYFKINKII